MKILVVDDDESIREALNLIISSVLGHEYIGCASIDECKCTLDKFKPDLIILDWLFGTIDAHEILDHVKNIYQKPPMIILTSASRFVEKKALDYGLAWLAKPFDIATLESTIQNCLK